jgi:hypothetical protein
MTTLEKVAAALSAAGAHAIDYEDETRLDRAANQTAYEDAKALVRKINELRRSIDGMVSR